VRDALRELHATIAARHNLTNTLVELHRERTIALARMVERDIDTLLN
jgi:hypothetical protein